MVSLSFRANSQHMERTTSPDFSKVLMHHHRGECGDSDLQVIGKTIGKGVIMEQTVQKQRVAVYCRVATDSEESVFA